MAPSSPARRRRRWFQISLRAMLLLTILTGVASGWVGAQAHQHRLEQAIVADMQAVDPSQVFT